MNTENIPYIKKMDNNGSIVNPITDRYISVFPNRKERRKKEVRFRGNGNNFHLSVIPTGKFRRIIQYALGKDGRVKQIYHYI